MVTTDGGPSERRVQSFTTEYIGYPLTSSLSYTESSDPVFSVAPKVKQEREPSG